MKLVKWLLGGVVALVLLAVAAIVIIPMVVPMEDLVAEGAAKVEEATGRKLTVGGEPELSLWPEVAIRLEKVAFANAAGAADANMATADAVRIAVPVMPLLSGAVEVKEFVLVKPDIRLSVDKNGKPNWDFGKGGKDAKADDKDAGGGQGGGLPDGLQDFKLGDVRIEDGRVSYTDAKSGATEVLEDVDLKVSLPSLSGPLDLDGALTWKGERIELDVNMAKPLAAAEAGKSALKAEVEGAHLEVEFDGEAAFEKGFALAGKASVKTPSIKKLAAWAAAPIEMEGDVLGPFEADGTLSMNGGRIAFSGANLAIDAIKGKGDFALDTGGKVPSIAAKLALGPLNLNPYMGGGAGDAGAAKPAENAGPGKWSEEPIDLSGLKAVNANLNLSVESLQVQQIKIGQSALAAKLQGGVLNLDLTKMALYGGSGVGSVKVDASKKTPTVAKSFTLKGIQAEPLLTDAANFAKLSGKGDLNIKVNAAGVSQAAMVKSAAGGGAFAFKDGAVKGFNLGSLIRQVKGVGLDSGASKQQQTDFSELTGTFKITKGVVTNNDLFMQSPLFRVTGKGQSSMPARTVNYRVEPKAVATTKGQGGKADAAGITVPVIIKGPWHNLSYTPDLTGVVTDLVKDPSKALDAVKGVAGGAGDIVKEPAKAVEGLLKGGSGDSGAGGAVKKLKGLLGN